MDIAFVRTFLAVAAAGSFVGAASRLHLTQSTVSARIQALETQLGASLFRRGRSGAELTAAGHRFLRHAKALVLTLEQARHDVGLPAGYRGTLTLSGRLALWDGFLPQWVARMRESHPDISLRLEVGFEEDIMQELVQGTVDVGVVYTPESRPGLGIERLFDEELVLVTTGPAGPWSETGYVHMDWGLEFQRQFATTFPHMAPPAITANIGWVAMQQILHLGGSGYFPRRIVRKLLDDGLVWQVAGSPSFSLTAFMVFPLDRGDDVLSSALESLRTLAAAESLIGDRGRAP